MLNRLPATDLSIDLPEKVSMRRSQCAYLFVLLFTYRV